MLLMVIFVQIIIRELFSALSGTFLQTQVSDLGNAMRSEVSRGATYIHTYINFISIRILNSTIVLVSPNTMSKLGNQIYHNNYI